MSNTIALIEKHLDVDKNVIQIVNGTNKYAKDSSVNRYNWTKSDILLQSSSLFDFLKQLQSRGFSSGTKVILKKPNGNSYSVEGETTLGFKDENHSKQAINTMQTPAQNQPHNSNHTAMAMGYTPVPQDEVVKMKVKAERYDETKEALNRARKERDAAESDLRQQKEDNAALQRKLDLIEEKHEFAMMRAEKDRKSFMDSEAGQLFISKGMEVLPQLGAILKGQSQQVPQNGALGQPTNNYTDMQNLFISEVEKYDDDKINILSQLADAIDSHPEFKQHLEIALSQI